MHRATDRPNAGSDADDKPAADLADVGPVQSDKLTTAKGAEEPHEKIARLRWPRGESSCTSTSFFTASGRRGGARCSTLDGRELLATSQKAREAEGDELGPPTEAPGLRFCSSRRLTRGDL